MMFSVAYYWQLRNVVKKCYMYYYYSTNKCSIGSFDIIEHKQLYFGKKVTSILKICVNLYSK